MAKGRKFPDDREQPVPPDLMEPIQRLTRDLKAAAQTLGPKEARWITDLYYQVQDYRVRAASQVRSSEPPEEDTEEEYHEAEESPPTPEPNQLLAWVFESMERLENDIKRALDSFTKTYAVGRWLQSITGIGPVISAGILSHLDIRKAKTAGHFWRFAGQDPTSKWYSKEEAKKLIQNLIAEEKDRVFNPADAVLLYAQYAKHARPSTPNDELAASNLFNKHGAKLVRAVIPTLARIHNRDNLKGLQIKDFEKQFGQAVNFYKELCETKELVDSPEELDMIDLNLVRIVADKSGRNVYNLFHMAQRRDRQGLTLPPNLESLSKALCKRPWNADLKRLMFLAGDCFVKVKNNPKDIYGKIYEERKRWEADKNSRFEYQAQAEQKLATTKIGKDTEAYKHYSKGFLPPGHLHMRALRYASKIFLSHVHHVMYVDYFHEDPPAPYAFEHVDGDHRHFIPVPNFPWEGGGAPLKDLLDKQ